ncbi:MAG: carbon monoxide dehydrogenase [Alphaproteobacteria bacterium]|nr:carbon monoxide dehydrogenase [Alphaproteobacteria bacterium]
MEMSGEYRIAAAKSVVWTALNDPEVLKACIPGCETVDKISDTEFTATVTARVGPVAAKFKGKVTLSDLDPPNGYTISGEGQGGAVGFGKGGAKVSLVEDGGATLLRYEAKAQVGGKLAQIGARLIDGAAKKMADDFFAGFAARVTASAAATAAEPAVATSDQSIAPAPGTGAGRIATAAGPKGLSPLIWVIGLVVAAAVVLVIVTAL